VERNAAEVGCAGVKQSTAYDSAHVVFTGRSIRDFAVWLRTTEKVLLASLKAPDAWEPSFYCASVAYSCLLPNGHLSLLSITKWVV
jgi:hypothetical protein